MGGQPTPTPIAETIWTLIPRGIATSGPTKGKVLFTAFVSPAHTGAGPNTPLSPTWVNWYDHVAAAVDGGRRQFLQIRCDVPGNPPLKVGIAPDSVCPVLTPAADSPEEALWKPLWRDLTRIFPQHLAYIDPPLPTTARAIPHTGRAHLLNASFSPGGGRGAPGAAGQATNAIESAWLAGQITTCTLKPKSMTQVQAMRTLVDVHTLVSPRLSQLETLATPAALTLRTSSLSNKVLSVQPIANDLPTQQALQKLQSTTNDEAVLANESGDPHADAVTAINAEINSWIASVAALASPSSSQAVLVMKRDLGRLSSDPQNQLRAQVLLYIYESRRARANDGFVPKTTDPINSVRNDTTDRQKQLIDYAVFHRRCNDSTIPDSTPWDNSSAALLQYGAFQKVLGDLGNYPPLLRCLGLAFDLIADPVDWSSANEAWIEFIDPTVASNLGAVGKQPTTLIYKSAFVVDGGEGVGDFKVQAGFLSVAGDDVVDYDPDGHALRKIQYASSTPKTNTAGAGGGLMQTAPTAGSSSNSIATGVLPMRSAGLTLRNDNHPKILMNRVSKHIKMRNASPDSQKFTSTDLVRGYAPEVFWRKKWYRLTARRESYKYRAGGDPNSSTQVLVPAKMRVERAYCPVQMEAAVHYDHPTNTGPEALPYDPHIASSLFRWDGWSLSVPNPFEVANRRTPEVVCQADTPIIRSIDPASAQQGQQNLSVTILGQSTHFINQTTAIFGDEITVVSLTVNSLTNATAVIDIDRSAATGARKVTLTSGKETVALMNAFTITPSVKNPIVSDFDPPVQSENQLPKLRFGECYQFRVRALDLAGDPIEAPASDTDALCSPELPMGVYRRHDPIPPPVLLFDDGFVPLNSPGEQIDVMVVRAEIDDYAPIRHLCPPTADLLSLIHQAAFDRPDGNMRSPFDVGSFDDVELKQDGSFPTNSLDAPIYRVPRTTPPSGAYLPDRFASYLCLQLFDIATGASYGPIEKRSFYDRLDDFAEFDPERNDYTWPHAGHMSLQMKTSNTNQVLYSWKVDELREAPHRRIPRLEIYVPRGWQMEMLISCAPTLEQAAKMAAGSMAADHLDEYCACMADEGIEIKKPQPEDLAVEHLLANGLSSQYTPSRPVNLVHAVKKPLGGASFSSAAAANAAADSAVAVFTGHIRVEDGRTTGALMVTVTWKEYRDDPTEPAPRTITHTQTLLQLPNLPLDGIGTPANPEQHGTRLAHDVTFPETKFLFPNVRHREVNLSVAAISRFQHLYLAAADQHAGSPASSEAPYMGPFGNLFPVSVPNASLPLPPSISRIMPLFPSLADGTVAEGTFRRIGGAVRIFLDRGWYSSGEGEMLGIVVAPAVLLQCDSITSNWLKDPVLSTLYTRWGADPVWDLDGVKQNNKRKSLKPAPFGSDFLPPNNLPQFDTPTVISNVPLVEKPDQTATILAYTPVFTPEDGWHCDVLLNHVPSYGCFIKFALVRYQANSISTMKISHVSSTPFVQLRPTRTLVLGRGDGNHTHLLTVFGTFPGSSADGTTEFRVAVEVHHDGCWIADDDSTIFKAGSACNVPSSYDDGSGDPQPKLDAYLVVVAKHFQRHRRVLVREYERRKTYDLATLQDTAPIAYLVDTSDPIMLTHA
jgi:hypothetical protein